MDMDAMILDLAEDDYTGLWELVWRARTVLGDGSASATSTALRPTVEHLLHNGRLAMFRGVGFAGDECPVSADEAPGLLAVAHSWEPPDNGESHLRVLATGASDESLATPDPAS